MGEVTQFDYLTSELILFNKEKLRLTQKVKECCQNKEYPLELRWKLFIKSDLGEHSGWCIDLESINLDDFYAEKDKYQEFTVDDLIFWIEEHEYENIDEIKEEILQLFVKSFT